MNTYRDAREYGHCDEGMYLKLISLKNLNQDEKRELADEAVKIFPLSQEIWIEYSNLNPSHEIFQMAVNNVASDNGSVNIWLKYIDWCVSTDSESVERIFYDAIKSTKHNLEKEKIFLRFIDWVYSFKGISKLREIFALYSRSHHITYKSLVRIIELEKCTNPRDTYRIISLFHQLQSLKPDDKGI